MWDDLIWSKNWKSWGISGSRQGAEIIEKGLKILDTPKAELNNKLTPEEVNLITEILNETGGGGSFLGFSSKISGRLRGEQFEQRIAKLLAKITNESEQAINVGEHQTRSGSFLRLTINTSGMKKLKKKQDLWDLVKEELQVDYQKLVDNATLDIINGFGTEKTEIIIRSGTRFGKVDINAPPAGAKITAELSEPIMNMVQEMLGHTFSLKNYLKSTMAEPGEYNKRGWGGVSLGYANDFRAFSSFYFGVTKDNNLANACTFIFSSTQSKDKTTKRYLSWARFVFELTGLGLIDVTDPKTNTLVDYLIINTSNAKAYGRIRVLWTGSLLQGIPNEEPPYKQVELLTKEDGSTTSKWVFSNFSFS